MREQLRAALLADAGVAALVERRVTWGSRSQSSRLPAVVLTLITEPSSYTLRGLRVPTRCLVQADCLGGAYREAVLTADAVRAALHALINDPLEPTLGDTRDDDFTQADGPDPSGASEIHRIIVEAEIWSS